MALSVLIVDDEALARARMKTLLADCTAPEVRVDGEAANAAQAVEQLRARVFDLVLLDVNMPGTDGLTLAQTLAGLPAPPKLVFVTAHAEHALRAFELDAVDYLTKPVRQARLAQALQKVERLVQATTAQPPERAEPAGEVLIIQERGRTERVPLSEVLYFKAELKYVTVRTRAKSHILDGSLSELEERHGTLFMRIHRNALVARRVVRALEKHYDPEEGEGWAVRLTGVDELLTVSRRQLAAVRELVAAA